MSTISTALRHFKEPTKEQLTQIFFSLPAGDDAGQSGGLDQEKMDINAVLSLGEAIEDSYVSLSYCICRNIHNASRRLGSCI